MCFPFSLVDLTEKKTSFFLRQPGMTTPHLLCFCLFILLYSRLFWPKKQKKNFPYVLNISVEIFMHWLVKWEEVHSSRKYWHSMFLAIFPCSARLSRFTCHATWRLVGTMKYKNHSLVPSLVREETDVFGKFSTKHLTFKQVSQLFMIFQSNWAYRIAQRQIMGEWYYVQMY